MKRVLKGMAWMKAPRFMFAKRHPRKAAFLAASSWVANRIRRRRRPSYARTAMQGIGAAAVAIPLGVWVGRKVRGANEPANP
jgi:beta-lactamase regulating signal transducer with metallopeptidase domain